MKAKNICLIGVLFVVLFFHSLLFAVPVDLDIAANVAEFQLLVTQKIDSYTTSEITTFKNEEGDTLAYIAALEPLGFIVITPNTDLTPVLAYSFTCDFPMDDKDNILYQLVKNDMELRLQAISDTTFPKIVENNGLWSKYISEDIDYFLGSDFQQWPPEGSTSTGGWIETTWSQGSPYWDFCPLYPGTNSRCLVGCVATSLAQIINYYNGYFGDATFSDEDDYTSYPSDPDIHIDDDCDTYDFPSFPELNSHLNNLSYHYRHNIPLTNENLAALSFACGVSLKMQYGNYWIGSYAGVNIVEPLIDKYEYLNAEDIDESDSIFYTTLISNMMEGKPAVLTVRKPDSGDAHSIICDGYNTNGFYHLNFGWGEISPDYILLAWYSLPEGIPTNYNDLQSGVLNITPPQGTVEGNVVLNGGNGNVTDVNILVGNRIYHPDINGNYSIQLPSKYPYGPGGVDPPTQYDITASLYGFEDSTVVDVEVYKNHTTIVQDIILSEYEPVIINVPDDQPTIQSGIDVARDSDTVLVSEGTYYENINFNGKKITVCSKYVIDNDESYITNTIIDGNQNGQVVKFNNREDSRAVLSGFTIKNGNAENSSAIYIKSSSPRLEHLTITKNHGKSAIYCFNASPFISEVTISDNELAGGAALWCLQLSYPVLKNVNIIDNYSEGNINGIVCSNSDPNLINVTISGNVADDYHDECAGIYCDMNSTPTLVSCIVWGNAQQSIYLGDNCDVIAKYSDIDGGWPGEGNQDIDPQFVNPSSGDYSLSQISPCIDAGHPEMFDPDGTRADMGAFTASLETYRFDSDRINWSSFPILHPNKIDAYEFFEPLIQNQTLKEVRYTDTLRLYYRPQVGWINDIGDLRTVDGYRVEMYEPDSLSVYGYRVQPDTLIYLYAEENKAPEYYPPIGYHNWIGYFLPYSQSPRDAFANVWDNLTFIKADNYTLLRKWNSDEWVGMARGPVSVDYGKSYAVGVIEDCSFTWHQSPFDIDKYVKPETELFTYKDEMNYMPIFVDSTEALNGIDEIGVFLEDECIGASVVEGFPVFIPAYIEEDSTGSKDYNELTFQVATYDKSGKASIPAFVYDETQDAFVKEPVILDARSYAVVRLGTGEGIEFPHEFTLYQNYPNPVINSTTISFIPSPGVEKSEIEIFNIKGQLVKQFKIESASRRTKINKVVWDGKDAYGTQVGNGIYFYKVTSGNRSAVKKMVIMR